MKLLLLSVICVCVGLVQQHIATNVSQSQLVGSQPLSPDEAAQTRRTIVAWLECDECTEGELAAVAKLGNVAVPTLIATLQHGPSSASREELRQHLIAGYRNIQRSTFHRETVLSEGEYVRLYMDNYAALYQVRSAVALAEIGGGKAAEALLRAMNWPLREDVRRVVRDSLSKVEKSTGKDKNTSPN